MFILLGIFLLAVLLEPPYGASAFLILAVLMAIGGIWEFLSMYERLGRKSFRLAGSIIGAISVIYAFFIDYFGVSMYSFLALLTAAAWFSLLLGGNNRELFEKALNTITGYFMVIVPLIPLILIYRHGHGGVSGKLLLIYMILVTKSGDTGAYLTGTISNYLMKGKNHKIVPSISPKKSWEGTIGGMCVSIVLSFILWKSMLGLSGFILPVFAGALLFFGGFCGDLVESVMKRVCGVKDSGSVFPGMGGVLDVVDSLILNAPLFYFILIPFIK